MIDLTFRGVKINFRSAEWCMYDLIFRGVKINFRNAELILIGFFKIELILPP
jgi:hypothetical protein